MADPSAGRASPPADTDSPTIQTSRFAPTDERRRLLAANAIVFLVAFLGYWMFGPQSTPYDFQLSLANNIVHGHIDMTEEYTNNLIILERVLYDPDVGFCLPVDDPRAPRSHEDNPDTPITANCKHYMQHSLGPAILMLPFAFFFGLDVNQVLISAVVGGLTAVLAYSVVRHFTQDRRAQVALMALAIFGTTLWYTAANGGVWYFAHTTAVFFVVGSIWATVVRRNALLAGVLVGAAFMCRPTTIFAGVFPLVAFANEWYRAQPDVPLWKRFDLRPLIALAVGVAPFIVLTGVFNYARFNSPFETGYNYSEEFHQLSLIARWPYGVADPRYIPRHIQVVFEQMPNFGPNPPFVWPSWWGAAMWITTPAILIAPFIHLQGRLRQVGVLLAGMLGAACAFILVRAILIGLGERDWADGLVSTGIHLLPFALLLVAGVIGAILARDRLVLAAWLAIVAIAFADFLFAATGWSQFGYRYGLDFMPFLFLLVVIAVGQRLRWYHAVLIAAGVIVNLWGVLWIYLFASNELFGWTWDSF